MSRRFIPTCGYSGQLSLAGPGKGQAHTRPGEEGKAGLNKET